MNFNDLKTCAESQNILINVENNPSNLISLTQANKQYYAMLSQSMYIAILNRLW